MEGFEMTSENTCEKCEKDFHEDDLEMVDYLDECGNKMSQNLCDNCITIVAPRHGKD